MDVFYWPLFLLVINFSASLQCPPGWKQNGDLCYLFSHNKVTWAEAEAICRAFEGTLAEPTSQDSDNFLVAEAVRTQRKYWIGGSDIALEGTFTWTSLQLSFVYTNWIPGDPNNANAGEDCVLTNWLGDGKWADGDCEWKEYFICQQEDVGNLIG